MSARRLLRVALAPLWLSVALPVSVLLPTAAVAAELPGDTPEALRSFVEGLEPAQRERIASRLESLPPRRRARAFRRFEGASAEERVRILERLERRSARGLRSAPEGRGMDREAVHARLATMSPEERRAFRRQLQQWRRLDPAGRKAMRRRLTRFRELDPPAQEALVARSFPELDDEARATRLEALRAAAAALPAREGVR